MSNLEDAPHPEPLIGMNELHAAVAAERERCAKLCERLAEGEPPTSLACFWLRKAASAIRSNERSTP